MHLINFVPLAILSGFVAGLPASNAPLGEIQARDCSASIRAFNLERRAKRGHDKRSFWWTLLNNTCVLSPNVKGTDNWTEGVSVRSDLTDGQAGIELLMDIGVMDLSTCQPMTNALVEVWGANAMGQYGTFLRGANPTNEAGIAEMNTIFPGVTSGNAAHIGVRVHPNWTGGTSVKSNTAAYIGRLYFTDQWSVVIGGASPYSQNTIPKTPNVQDPVWSQASGGGYSPIIDIEEIHDDWPEGVVGYITVGVNPGSSVTA